MGTTVKTILDSMLSRIPKEFKTELAEDYELAEQGIIEMGITIGADYSFDGDGAERQIDAELSMAETWLAARFSYRCYLERLWDELNRNAVNFSTLTFSIKDLQKRPESIQDELYKLNRYLDGEIARATGVSSIVGMVSEFGGA